MDIKHKTKKAIDEVLKDLGVQELEYTVDFATNLEHGDITTNVALLLAKPLTKSPREIAETIKNKMENDKSKMENIDSVDVAGPGFINFWISQEELIKNIQQIASEKEKFGASNNLSEKKMMFEFGDPNPFKEFHIGHLYTTTIGESLSRLAESQRATVWRACYQGDVGMHVAKAIWGLLWIKKNKREDLGLWRVKSLSAKALLLGEAYARGSMAYEEDSNAKEEINTLNKKIYERSDQEINKLYDAGKKWSLEYFDTIYKRLGTHYEKHYFESEVGEIGAELVRKYIGDIFIEDQGAIIFPGKKYALHNRVFINSLGLPTYEAKELGLAPTKYADFPYDTSVIITGNEINEYFKVLLKALSFINPDLSEKTHHLGHGMVRLPSGKMSSRTGNVITGEWLLDSAKQNIMANYPEMDSETAEMVAVAAVKYALLKSGIGHDVEFSLEQSISLEGNSGPYLQYTYARTQSVIRKAGTNNYELITNNYEFEQEELALLRFLVRFPDLVAEAAESFSPNLICTYLFELAQKFNLFYQKHSILEGGEKKEFRLALTLAVGQTLKNGLYLLGIQSPEKM